MHQRSTLLEIPQLTPALGFPLLEELGVLNHSLGSFRVRWETLFLGRHLHWFRRRAGRIHHTKFHGKRAAAASLYNWSTIGHEELCQRPGSFFFQHCALVGLAGAQVVSLRMGGNAPSFANNARQRQALSHVSSLDDSAGFHWMDVDDLSSDPPSQQDHQVLFKAFYVYVCMYVPRSLWFSALVWFRSDSRAC
jgi:hypothetical protein